MGAGLMVGSGFADAVRVVVVLDTEGGDVEVGTLTTLVVVAIAVVEVGDTTEDSNGGSTGGSAGGTVTSSGPILPVSL
jgi:hypothetical protein